DKADALAKKGITELSEGKRVQARDDLRVARWYLPGIAPGFPPHVTKVFGSPKLRQEGTILALAYAPDGKTLAVLSADLRDRIQTDMRRPTLLKLWDTSTGLEKLVYTGHTLPSSVPSLRNLSKPGIGSVAFSPDGKVGASVGTESAIRLWDPHTGK